MNWRVAAALAAASAWLGVAGCAKTQVSYDDWNTTAFFAGASIAEVSRCSAADADQNARDEYGRTLLHWAALLHQDPAVIVALVDAGADPNGRDERGWTPLHSAVADNDILAVIAALMSKARADLNTRDEEGVALPRAAAAHSGMTDFIAALSKARADLNTQDDKGAIPLRAAANGYGDGAKVYSTRDTPARGG